MIVNEKKIYFYNIYLINWVCMIIFIKIVFVLIKCILIFLVEILYFNNFINMYLNILKLINIVFYKLIEFRIKFVGNNGFF